MAIVPRGAHATAAVDAVSGITSIMSALRSQSGPASYSVSWQRKLAAEELYKLPKTLTPYGTICETESMQGKVGELSIYHTNPFALLHYACEHYSGFQHLLAEPHVFYVGTKPAFA